MMYHLQRGYKSKNSTTEKKFSFDCLKTKAKLRKDLLKVKNVSVFLESTAQTEYNGRSNLFYKTAKLEVYLLNKFCNYFFGTVVIYTFVFSLNSVLNQFIQFV